LVIPGDQWPVFLYAEQHFDPEDPWKGLFRSIILVFVRILLNFIYGSFCFDCLFAKAYKHVFTSPSSVDNINKATRSGNARIHSMTQVTPASIAYIATQVSSLLASLRSLS
jgi:hypothetical protein